MTDSLDGWVGRLFENPDFLRMGHGQRKDDLNLGLGWMYYALARILRPARVVVIGSWRGFTPLVFSRALADNGNGGRVLFIDPSLVDEQWRNPDAVAEHFARYGAGNVDHRLMTTQQFVETQEYRDLREVGLVFVDGLHTAEQAAIDFGAFESRLSPDGMILLHDSAARRMSKIYGPDKAYEHTVIDFVAELKQRRDLQVLDLPYDRGVTLVRKIV